MFLQMKYQKNFKFKKNLGMRFYNKKIIQRIDQLATMIYGCIIFIQNDYYYLY